MSQLTPQKLINIAAGLKKTDLLPHEQQYVIAIAANMSVPKKQRQTDIEIMEALNISHRKYYDLKSRRETKDLMEKIVYETAIKAIPNIMSKQIERAELGDSFAVRFVFDMIKEHKEREESKRGGKAQEIAAIEQEFVEFVSEKFGKGTIKRVKITQ